MKKAALLFSIIIYSIHIYGSNPVNSFLNNPLLQNANVSLLVKDLKTGKTLYQSGSKKSIISASTIKLITTATALELYGPDFRFETRLVVNGEITKDGTLAGNLYIRGGGDPTLGSDKTGDKDFLTKWIAAIRMAGIKNIKGKIIADPGIFDQQVINPQWTWEDMGNYFAPGIHGISYLDNTFRLIFSSGKVGTTPEILRTQPEIVGLKIENLVKSSDITYDNAYFFGAPFSFNRYITGEIPANKNEFAVKGDIPNPSLLLAQHLHKKLIEYGSLISDSPTVQTNQYSNELVIYKHFSPPLSEIITEINVKSNNHYAEYLFKYLGIKNNNPATTEIAIENIRNYWKVKGLSVDQLFQADGSGLSPVNAVSAHFFVELLTFMQTKSKYADIYYNSLPVSGVNGTLKDLLLKTTLQGKVHAKSGTLARVKSYAGFIEANEKTLVFALIVNNPNGTSKEMVKKMEEFLLNIAIKR